MSNVNHMESRSASGEAWASFSPEVEEFDPTGWVGEIESRSTCRDYLEEERVFGQGEPALAVFYIKAGKAKLTVVSKAGKEAVVALLPENSFLGEGCLAGQAHRMFTASCVLPSTIIRIDRSVMASLLEKDKHLAARFLKYVLSRNIRMEADLVGHLFNSSEKRLAHLLLLMANFGFESAPIPMIPKISQETLAEMIGTTRPRVNFFLNRFRELGFIDYNSAGMEIHSSLMSIVVPD